MTNERTRKEITTDLDISISGGFIFAVMMISLGFAVGAFFLWMVFK